MEHSLLPNNEPDWRSRCFLHARGMSMIEILVAMGIIAVLAALLIPALAAARERADAVRCMGNLRQVGTALLQMAADQRGVLKHWYSGTQSTADSSVHWVSQLKNGGYLTMEEMTRLRCSALPRDTTPNTHNWGFNLSDPHGTMGKAPGGQSNSRVYQIIVGTHPAPSRSVLLAGVSNGVAPDSPGAPTDLRIFPTGSASLGRIQLPHDGRGEMYFLDGHAEIATPRRLTEISQTFGTSDSSQPVEYYDESHVLRKSPTL